MLIVKPDPHNSDNEIKALNAFIDDTPCGYVRFRLRGYIIVITELLPLLGDPAMGGADDADLYGILDTVIRALGSYGLNHSCYYLECDDPALYTTLGRLRFVMKDGMMKSNLQMILKSCGH